MAFDNSGLGLDMHVFVMGNNVAPNPVDAHDLSGMSEAQSKIYPLKSKIFFLSQFNVQVCIMEELCTIIKPQDHGQKRFH